MRLRLREERAGFEEVEPGGIEFWTVAVVYARRVTVVRGILASTFEFASHLV